MLSDKLTVAESTVTEMNKQIDPNKVLVKDVKDTTTNNLKY